MVTIGSVNDYMTSNNLPFLNIRSMDISSYGINLMFVPAKRKKLDNILNLGNLAEVQHYPPK